MICETDIFNERYNRVQKEIEKIGAEIIITVCPSCFKTYNAYSNKKLISYWEIMQEEIGIPNLQKNIGRNSDIIFNIHAPCVTRNMSSHHESIRWILDEMGYKYEEMAFNKTNTRCCGVGGMLGCVDLNYLMSIMQEESLDSTQGNILTYCGSCRVSMENGGADDAIHILELIFREKPYIKSDADKRSANYGFHNRMDTKNRLMEISKKV